MFHEWRRCLVLDANSLRADGQRNRAKLLAVATEIFATHGADVSFEEIARRANVGIGTLYRHFPRRELLVEEVYRHDVDQLVAAATARMRDDQPADALRGWLRLSVDHIAMKKIVLPALASSDLPNSASVRLKSALFTLVEAARASGQIRKDTDPTDVFRALVGFTHEHGNPGWRASALRLVDILMDGLERSS